MISKFSMIYLVPSFNPSIANLNFWNVNGIINILILTGLRGAPVLNQGSAEFQNHLLKAMCD